MALRRYRHGRDLSSAHVNKSNIAVPGVMPFTAEADPQDGFCMQLRLQVRNGQFDETGNMLEVGLRLQPKLNPMRILGSLRMDNRI